MIKPSVRLRKLADILQADGDTTVYLGSACAVAVKQNVSCLDVTVFTETADGMVMQTFRLQESEPGQFGKSLTKGLQAALVPLTDVNGRRASVDAGIPVRVTSGGIEPATHCMLVTEKGEGIEAGMTVTRRVYYRSRLTADMEYTALRGRKVKARLWKIKSADEKEWVLEDTVPPQKPVVKETKEESI